MLYQYLILERGQTDISDMKYLKVQVTLSFVRPYRGSPKHCYLCMFHRELLLSQSSIGSEPPFS